MVVCSLIFAHHASPLIVGATHGRGVTSRQDKPAGSHFPRLFS